MVGYARISTVKQGEPLKTQQEALFDAGREAKHVFVDKISCAKWSRPALNRTLEFMHEGDTLAVTRPERLGRNVREAILTIADLGARGMNVRGL